MGGQNSRPTSFSSVTSTNVGISPQNFPSKRVLNPFATLVSNVKFIPNTSPKVLTLNQEHPSKNWLFWSTSYKIEIMITSLIEMLELPSHESHDQIYNVI